MKIALVQLNPVIGAYDENCDRIVASSQQAADAGCQLVIFPELALSGYPPQDLLERPAFLDAQDSALRRLLPRLPAIDVLFGCFQRNDSGCGKPLFNSAVVVRAGEIVHSSQKKLLPTYDVFDEHRYFEPGKSTSLYRVAGHIFGVTICEDIWADEKMLGYTVDPVADLIAQAKDAGEELTGIINISASPFQQHKDMQRRRLLAGLCRETGLFVYYCNQVGGQDSLIFDGKSFVMDAGGNVVAQAAGFAEDMVIFDSAASCQAIAPGSEDSTAAVHDALVLGLHDYVVKSGFSQVVLGLSGGIDSALTAALAVEALGADKVLGVALPSPYSSEESVEDARQLAKNLGCRFEILPITTLFHAFTSDLADLFAGLQEDVTEQNLQARIRGNLLMALSNKFGSMLLTTGNKSELAVGYCTLYGDMCGGLAVIADLPKGLVYDVARYINRHGERIPERTCTKAPSAELRFDQKDQDELPPYDTLDRILELYLEEGCGLEEIVGQGFVREMVEDVLRRVWLNEYKRNQAPLGLKVTSKAFGGGRRYPIVQKFRG